MVDFMCIIISSKNKNVGEKTKGGSVPNTNLKIIPLF
jgi:hypothetical protein